MHILPSQGLYRRSCGQMLPISVHMQCRLLPSSHISRSVHDMPQGSSLP